MNKKLSKEDEAKFPKFNNLEEAVAYFEEKYKSDFLFSNTFDFEGEIVRHYVLILDKEKYNEMQKWKKENRTFLFPVTDPTTRGFTDSFQGINIWENGRVQVII